MNPETPNPVSPEPIPQEPVTPPTTPAPQVPSVEPQPMPAPMSPMPEAAPKKGMPKLLKIALIVGGVFVTLFIGLFVLLFVVLANSSKAIIQVSDAAISDIQGNDPSGLYTITTSEFQTATSQDELDAILEKTSPALQGTAKVTTTNVQSINGVEQAAVVYTISTSGGDRYVKVTLQKDGDAWKILGFRSSATPLDGTIE